ncbi:MAG: COX15/CtaA family protein [Betaproteobacteria bacterium]|nr:COX15/CtaA family protein [Betaproteobacteria bacterium]
MAFVMALEAAPDSSVALPDVAPAATAAVPGRRAIAAWLLVCCALVFAMVVVGGVTRLTHSGLSIVEWQPIVGTLPPLSDAAWQEAFDKYKLTPEYRQVNHSMSLGEFKGIFWWEYFHRLLGRLIGVAFFVPLAWFWIRGRLDRPLAWKLAGIFVLGGLQGAMGWYMVMSGLVDDPRVSQFRLTAHLAIAVLIFATMLWIAMDLLAPRRRGVGAAAGGARRLAWWITGVVGYMVVTGGFVAGIRAGKAYNTFPLMQGHVVPPEIFMIQPWWQNFFYNMATVQFDHRLGAWALVFLVPWLWLRVRKASVPPRARLATHLLLAAIVMQITLGITTLVLAVPVALGAAHQGGAIVLLAAALFANHSLR